MSQTMMLLFSAGALLLLLPLLGDLALGEISKDFQQCLQFFYKRLPPRGITGIKYQPICQRYKNQYRFATMYDRDLRTAAYSAYILKMSDDSQERNEWKFEPQLVSKDKGSEMEDLPQTPDEDLKQSQAVLDDYRSNSSKPEYTKGHLAPVCHQETLHDREATYTLTNIVPQKAASNNGPWSELETRVLEIFKDCITDTYVITGVIPYEKKEKKKRKHLLKGRVSIPEYMWSAYCCPEYKNFPYYRTYAAVGRNDPDSGNDIVERGRNFEGYDVKEMSLEKLEEILPGKLCMPIKLFNENCQRKVKKGNKGNISKVHPNNKYCIRSENAELVESKGLSNEQTCAIVSSDVRRDQDEENQLRTNTEPSLNVSSSQ